MSSQDSDVTVAADEAPSSNGSSSPSLLSSASYSQDLANNDNNGAKQQLINYSTAESLLSIQTEQGHIDSEIKLILQQQGDINPLVFDGLKSRLLNIECILKQISTSNQQERKEIADILNTNGPSDSIKGRLIDLAQRQKTLLACFKRQNELSKHCNTVAMEINKAPPTSESSVVHIKTITGDTASTGLSQPVPLNVLIHHKLVTPGEKLTCTLLGCHFEAYIMSDGQLVDREKKCNISTPQVWLTNCWSALGHQKRLNKRQVSYNGVSLLSICEEYSRKQVNCYQQQKLQRTLCHSKESSQQPTHIDPSNIPASISSTIDTVYSSLPYTTGDHYDLDKLLTNKCRILSHPLSNGISVLSNAKEFWGTWTFHSKDNSLHEHLTSDLLQWPPSN